MAHSQPSCACTPKRALLLTFSLASATAIRHASFVHSPTSSAARPRAIAMQSSNLLREDMDKAIAVRGMREAALLKEGVALRTVKQRGGSSTSVVSSGFGKSAQPKGKPSSGKSAKPRKRTLSALAKEMQRAGVVRIDGALSAETADALREFVDSERAVAEAEVAAGTHKFDERFADLVLVENRCDFLMPLRGVTLDAMRELVGRGSVLGALIEEIIGEDAVMQEVACLISEPGSAQQPLHPDTPYTTIPTLYAGFVALQDVEPEMGPTVYLPGTHTREAHLEFYGGDLENAKKTSGERNAPVAEEFLQRQSVALGLLRKGDMVLYNQQVLHCGSANRSDRVRRQFYLSWRNPHVPVRARPSIRPTLRAALTLGKIWEGLAELEESGEGNAAAGQKGIFAELDALDSEVSA